MRTSRINWGAVPGVESGKHHRQEALVLPSTIPRSPVSDEIPLPADALDGVGRAAALPRSWSWPESTRIRGAGAPRPAGGGSGRRAARAATPQGVRTGLRISGLCRIADRPEWTFRWDQVGTNLELHPLAPDSAVVGAETSDGLESELLCLGPELALIGRGARADLSPFVAGLDAALLTDAKFAAGPEAWG